MANTKLFCLFFVLLLIDWASSYDFFKIAIQWSPSYCSAVTTCVKPVPETFNIHGLWPALNSMKKLEFCPTSILYNRNQLSPTLLSRLETSWKNLTGTGPIAEDSFWGREWKKHGSCSTQQFDLPAYFTQALDLYDQVAQSMLLQLQNHGITPGGGAMTGTTFYNAIQKVKNVQVELQCTKANEFLEARFCLQHDGETFIDCPSVGNSCMKPAITLPN